MERIDLEKNYNPKSFEERVYNEWESSGAFLPRNEEDKAEKVFSVVIPPPNVTGVLHMGHALNNTLQDIVVRFHRMTGERTLWLTGTDHAGIATQNVVEKQLKKDGTSKNEIGREEFLKRTWAVKDKHHAIITKQQRALGNSTDWTRERFTLDEGLSKAVRKVFVTLYERDLLYKGKYLVNWCPRCGTALSDDEVDHTDTKGAMYHIYYELEEADAREGTLQRIEIATTRPETLLGDTAVAVNPADTRYKTLIGKIVKLPLTGRNIPIIGDAFVDMTFGTGMVKITPAHDPNDYQSAKRNNLPMINILNEDGTLNDNCPEKYRGLRVDKAREVIVEDLKALGLFKGAEEITHSVGHCYRCNTVIEPYLSEQWFVRMEPLAKKALKAWEEGDVVFFPRKWENTYKYWLNNIKDWCISRQLWWGHRIPAWTCKSCKKLIVSESDPSACPSCGGQVEQDPDVLDTWFSSWLWPFSTLGWPEETKDLKDFYPTSALVTAYDIIFFWVSRMIMAGLEFTGRAPFHDIYIHGLVRDKEGRKMSKSLGNGMDPLEIIDEYGSDALKFTLSFMCAQGQDILIDKKSFMLGSRFCNKIWNASRYLLGNLSGRKFLRREELEQLKNNNGDNTSYLKAADKWIYKRLDCAIKATREALTGYRYNDAAAAVMNYFWGDFCDWYIESSKVNLRQDCSDIEKDRQTTILLMLLEENLRLLHPFVPFITEEIYSKLPKEAKTSDKLITASYPSVRGESGGEAFDLTKNIIEEVRAIRLECGVRPADKVKIALKSTGNAKVLCNKSFDNSLKETIRLMAGVEEITSVDEKPTGSVGAVGEGFEVFLLLDGVDKNALKEHFQKLITQETKRQEYSEKKLSPAFLSHASEELIAAEKEKIKSASDKIKKLNEYIAELE